ncbi:hypothetical protein J4433_03080 [Candidatus Pacearchaeota archaeon]|nr:hypothetical protein [Candidatus Pacearchaeota archaeon]
MAAGVRKFILYLARWQLSTPILYLAVRQLGAGLWQTVIANLIGGMIFFWIDRFIFTSHAVEMWHVKEGRCDNCGKKGHLWRLVVAPNYDRRKSKPTFFCMKCSKQKTDELRRKGIRIKGRSR